MRLTPLYSTQDEALAHAVKDMLKQQGLPAVIELDTASQTFKGAYGGAEPPWKSTLVVCVREQDLSQAQSILAGWQDNNEDSSPARS